MKKTGLEKEVVGWGGVSVCACGTGVFVEREKKEGKVLKTQDGRSIWTNVSEVIVRDPTRVVRTWTGTTGTSTHLTNSGTLKNPCLSSFCVRHFDEVLPLVFPKRLSNVFSLLCL